MILDFKILSLWFVIQDWWYNTLTRENNWFLNVLVKSNFATPTPFGSVSCFVVGICLSNYNLNSFLIHQTSYSKEYQRYLMHSRDRRDVTALASQVNKCTAVMWTVNFNITGNGKMMKNGPYLFKFTDFFISLRLFRRENIVFCLATIILIIIAPIFHKLLKNIGCGWGERPSVCDYLDVKEVSGSNILGALTH